MKLIKAHIWLQAKVMKGSVTDLPVYEMIVSEQDKDYFRVLLEDELIAFDDGKYIVTEKGILIIDTITAFGGL